jgi:monofunctional biosynthetic peptidoglycan transglycosylase
VLAVGVVAFLVADGLYLVRIWPDWESLKSGPVPESAFIRDYRERLNIRGRLPKSQWNPVPYGKIPAVVRKAFVVAEDGRFWQHGGVDWQALRSAMEANIKHRSFRYGASTISQQTAKNLFLTSDRTFLRKWHELLLTKAMERNLGKRRILEIYLNDAQLGQGVFGVAAAARKYWNKPLYRLSSREAAELAASLPSPARHNPATRTRTFLQRAATIHRNLKIVLRRG